MNLKYSTKPDDLEKINSPDELKKLVRTHQKAVKRQKWTIRALSLILAIITYLGLIFGLSQLASAFLVRNLVPELPVITVKRVQAAEIEQPKFPDIGDCEQYRPIVEKYFGKLTDEALFVAKNESGCIADRKSESNSDGTRDYCLFQINQEKLTAQSLDVCVRRAFEKYTAGRVGEKNWSAFYAVCDVNAKPKYPKTIKNCS